MRVVAQDVGREASTRCGRSERADRRTSSQQAISYMDIAFYCKQKFLCDSVESNVDAMRGSEGCGREEALNDGISNSFVKRNFPDKVKPWDRAAYDERLSTFMVNFVFYIVIYIN